MASAADKLTLTDSFRISFATYGDDGKLSPSLSLSKAEAMKLTKATKDEDIGYAPLSRFWNRIGKNSFCLPDGGVLKGTTTLADYYAAAKDHYPEQVASLTKKSPPTYTICYKEKARVPNDKKAGDTKMDLTLHTFETPNRDFKALPAAKGVDDGLVADGAQDEATRPALMSSKDWNEVLVVNSLLNGFVVDETTSALGRARKTAFRLLPNPVHPLKFSPGSVSTAELNSIKDRAKAAVASKAPPVNRVEDSLKPAFPAASQQHQTTGGTVSTSPPVQTSPLIQSTQPGQLAQSTQGKQPTQPAQSKQPAPAALSAQPKETVSASPAAPAAQTKTPTQSAQSSQHPQSKQPDSKRGQNERVKGKGHEGDDDDDEEGAADDPLEHLFPLWETCDDSRVRIETVSTTLQRSSVEQGFSAKSVEAAAELSTTKLAGGGSYGSSSSNKSGKERESGNVQEQMHATYEFPRVRLYLDRESITLSDDCKAALDKIQTERNYYDIVDFYKNYGTLFVTRVKLGGRLRATKLIDGTMAAAKDSAENAWKTSIAASLSIPVFSASYDSKKEGATASETQSQGSAMLESVCWEAHGGNTLLANNPAKWCGTVEPFWFWRVVEQEVVLPIEHIISNLQGYGWVRRVFAELYVSASFPSQPMEILWNGANHGEVEIGQGLAGSGVEAKKDLLRKTLVKVQETNVTKLHDPLQKTWTVIANNASLHKYITQAFEETINPWIKTKLFPNHVFKLAVGDRAFSIVLRMYRPVERAVMGNFEYNQEKPTDTTNYQTVYGDRFVRSSLRGFCATVCWTFISEVSSSEHFRLQNEVANFFATADPTMHFAVGCTFLAKVANAIQGSVNVVVYDPYYEVVSNPLPEFLVPELDKRLKNFPRQVLRVEIAAYDQWLGGLPSSVTSPADVLLYAVKALRSDYVDYAFSAVKRHPDVCDVAPSFQFLGKLPIAGDDFVYAVPPEKLTILQGRMDAQEDQGSQNVEFVQEGPKPPSASVHHLEPNPATVDGEPVTWSTEFSVHRLVQTLEANMTDIAYPDLRAKFGPAGDLAKQIDNLWDGNLGKDARPGGLSYRWKEDFGDELYFERLLRLIRMGRRDEALKLAAQPFPMDNSATKAPVATNSGSGAAVTPASTHPGPVTYGLTAERNPSRLDRVPGAVRSQPILYPLQDVIVYQLPNLPYKHNDLDLLVRRTPFSEFAKSKVVPSATLWWALRIVNYTLSLKKGHWNGKGVAPPSCIGVEGPERLWVGLTIEEFWEAKKPDGWEILQVWVAYAPLWGPDIWGAENIAWE